MHVQETSIWNIKFLFHMAYLEFWGRNCLEKKMGTGAPVMELRGYPRASYSPSIKGDEIDSASSAALRLCSPKNFCSPIFFPKLFYPTSFFFSPGPCFHFTANTIWFGFHDIPAQRLSHSAGAPARRGAATPAFTILKVNVSTPVQEEHTHHPKITKVS